MMSAESKSSQEPIAVTIGTLGPEPNYEAARIDEEKLRAKLVGKPPTSGDAIASFKQVVREEMTRAVAFAQRMVDGEGEQLKRIVHAVSGPRIRAAGIGELLAYRSQTQEVMGRLCKLEGFIEGCLLSVEKLVRSQGLGEPELTAVRLLAQSVGLSSALLDNACVALADVFESIKQQQKFIEQGQVASVGGAVWVPPDSFERSSKKFVVPRGRCFEVRAKVSEQLPVLIMNRASVDAAVGVPSDFLAVAASSWVSSQYLDNEAFDSYHTRVQRLDGAKAYRIRWYSSLEPPKLQEDVYVERKTHHVDWVAAPSVKERFRLPCAGVKPFLAGTPPPDLSGKNQRLAAEIQSELKEKSLRPILRTVVRRTAFQSTSTNDVRVSFDEDCAFLDEQTGIVKNPCELPWCSSASIPGELAKNFGNLGVMEVKLKNSEKLPPWIKELEVAGAIIALPNLSKFCHGVCCFHYDTGKVTLQPYWFEAVRNGTLGAPAPLNNEVVTGQPNGNASGKDEKENFVTAQPAGFSLTSVFARRRKITDSQASVSEGRPSKPGIALRPKKPPEAKTFFANERTLLQWISPVSLVLSIAIAMLGWSTTLDDEAQRSMGSMAVAMMILSMCWLAYALYVFFKRMSKIRGRKDEGFDEVFGPTMMVLSLFCLCVLAIVLVLVRPLNTDDEVVVATYGRPCVHTLANYTSFPALSAEPSGVIYYPTRNSIFVASLHHLFEIKPDGTVEDYHYPGFDIEAVTLDPSSPNTLYLAIENPNQIVALNALTMQLYSSVNVATALKAEQQLEAIAVCPKELCGGGTGNLRFLVGGKSDSLRVIDFGDYPIGFPYSGVTVVDEIDLDALMCRRIGRCTKRDAGRITDLYISSDAIYALAERDGEIFKIPWSANTRNKLSAPELPTVLTLPRETRGGWQGFALRPEAGGGYSALLANDFHGFVKDFELGAAGLVSTC
jgi:uncharacterized membrane protein YidH (DUF202 family)